MFSGIFHFFSHSPPSPLLFLPLSFSFIISHFYSSFLNFYSWLCLFPYNSHSHLLSVSFSLFLCFHSLLLVICLSVSPSSPSPFFIISDSPPPLSSSSLSLLFVESNYIIMTISLSPYLNCYLSYSHSLFVLSFPWCPLSLFVSLLFLLPYILPRRCYSLFLSSFYLSLSLLSTGYRNPISSQLLFFQWWFCSKRTNT